MTSISSSELAVEKVPPKKHPSTKKLAQRTLRLEKIVGNILVIGESYWRKENVSAKDFYPRLTSARLGTVLRGIPAERLKKLVTVPKHMQFVVCKKVFNVTLKTVREKKYNLDEYTYNLIYVNPDPKIDKIFEELLKPEQKCFIEIMKQSLHDLVSKSSLIILSSNSGPIFLPTQDICVWHFRRIEPAST